MSTFSAWLGASLTPSCVASCRALVANAPLLPQRDSRIAVYSNSSSLSTKVLGGISLMSSLNASLVLGHRLILHHHPKRRVPSCESFLIPAGRSRATPTSPTTTIPAPTTTRIHTAKMSAVTMHNVAWPAVAPAPMHYPPTYRAVPAYPASELYDVAAERAYDAYMPRDDVRPHMDESLVKKRTRQRVYPSEEAKQAAKMLQKARRREQNRNAQRRLRDRKEEHIFKVSPHAPLGSR